MSESTVKRILIAEDDFAIALALKTIIRNNFDCELTLAHNGQEAWEAIQKSTFDLVLSDWNMPQKTGCELLNEVRLNSTTQHLPFIMLTARADKNSVINAVKSGVTDYIHKPFNRAALIEKISHFLKLEDPAQAANDATPQKKRPMIDVIADKLRSDQFSLPVVSNTAITVEKLLKDPNISVTDIANVIKNDPTITLRLIALSNNAQYRGSIDNATLQDAITRLGLNETLNYLWIFSNASLFNSADRRFSTLLIQIRNHAIATAEAAKAIAQLLKLDGIEQYYYFGLLHDIGAILVTQILEELSKQAPLDDPQQIHNVIRKLHCKFGGVLLDRWGLSSQLQMLALYHENPQEAENISTELQVIHFADQLSEQLGFSLCADNPTQVSLTDTDFAKQFGLNEDHIELLSKRVNDHVHAVSNIM